MRHLMTQKTSQSSDYVTKVKHEVMRHQGVTAEFGMSRRHNFVTLTFAEKKRRVTFPCTPSDSRGTENFRSDVRRALREMGAERK